MTFSSGSRSRRPRPVRARLFRPLLEGLEDRLQPSFLTPGGDLAALGSSLAELEGDPLASEGDAGLFPDQPATRLKLRLPEAAIPPDLFAGVGQGGVRVVPVETATNSAPTSNATAQGTDQALALGANRTTAGNKSDAPVGRQISMQVLPLDAGQFSSRPQQFQVVRQDGSGAGASPAGPVGDLTGYVTGTTSQAEGRGVALDPAGNSYVTGWVGEGASRQGFVAKYNAAGAQVYRVTFQATDRDRTYTRTEGRAIAVDATGNAYVTGTATWTLFGLTFDTDAYALKLNADGGLVYGISYGSLRDDQGNGIGVDALGRAYVTGSIQPSPTQTVIFHGQLRADGFDFVYEPRGFTADGFTDSTGTALTLDETGANAYLAGWIVPSSGDRDLFVLKVDNATGTPVYAFTSVPNLGDDTLTGIAVNRMGQAYVSGVLVVKGTTPLAYAAKVNAAGSDAVYAILLDDTTSADAIALNADTEEAHLAGWYWDGPVTHAYAVRLDPFGTLAGVRVYVGNSFDWALGIAYQGGRTYVAGGTNSTDLATDGTALLGAGDAFWARAVGL